MFKSIKTKFWTFIARRKCKKTGLGMKVNARSSFSSYTETGNFCNFNGIKIQGRGRVIIGNYFHSGQECLIITENHNYEGQKIPYDETSIVKEVVIGDCVWLGSRVIILGGVHIGEGAIIQAGSVVVRDVPPCAVVGGNPAQIFKWRDKDHYYELKEKELYH